MKVIGLGHYSRTGKDSLANAIVQNIQADHPGLRVAKIPFAWKLKQICHDLYGWAGMREPEFYDTPEGEPFRDIVLPAIGKTPVQIWVDMGTPAVREKVYDRTWIDYLLKSSHDLDVLLVPDVRFQNEVSAMRDVGATLIKVVRPGYGPRKTVADRALLGYEGWDYVLGRTGDINELRGWGRVLAHWLADDARQPVQLEQDRRAASAVEVIEPWEPPAEKSFDLQVDEYIADLLVRYFDLRGHETLTARDGEIIEQISVQFPHFFSAARRLDQAA